MRLVTSDIIQNKRVLLGSGRLLQVGALVYRILSKELHILLITSRKRKRWIVPKGWPMPGKTLSQAALQEAYEEAGIRGDVEDYPFGYYTYEKISALKDKSDYFNVEVFIVQFSRQEKEWPEFKQRTSEWVTPKVAINRVNEPQLKQIFLKFSYLYPK